MTDIPAIWDVARAASQKVSHELCDASKPDSLSKALSSLTESYEAIDRPPSYGFEPEDARAIRHQVARDQEIGRVEFLNRLLLLQLLSRLPHRLARNAVPAPIEPLLVPLLQSILKSASQKRTGHHLVEQDRYRKDLAICLLHLLPVGPELAELTPGLRRSVAFGPPWSQSIQRTAFIASRIGGLGPLFCLHLDRRLAREFCPDGYNAAYRRLAELLIAKPAVKGVWSGFTWFLDPAMCRVSPELEYLHKIPTREGAMLLRGQPYAEDTSAALMLSPHRRKLFENGEYSPCPYSWIWPRRDVLRFAGEL